MENNEKGINNFLFTAYNNRVETITLAQRTQNGRKDLYIPYIYKKLKEKYAFSESDCKMETSDEESRLTFCDKDGYSSHIKRFTDEHIADVLVIGYKYDFFCKNLSLPLLDDDEKFLLYVSLVAADYVEDKKYVLRRLSDIQSCSLDGVFNFRLVELKSRWKEVAEYIPADFGKYSLESFLDYVIADGEGRGYLKNGKAYDENYRLLDKSELFGKSSQVAELLLGGVGQVYCFGETDETTKAFLKKYYKEKAVFC